MGRRSQRNRANSGFNIRQGVSFCLVLVFCLISLHPSPMKPDIPDFHWSFIGFFFALIAAFIYLISDSVGPNYGEDE